MHKKPEGLGNIIKAAREKSGITIENLAYKVGITERYLIAQRFFYRRCKKHLRTLRLEKVCNLIGFLHILIDNQNIFHSDNTLSKLLNFKLHFLSKCSAIIP